jgi:hypothetical protein
VSRRAACARVCTTPRATAPQGSACCRASSAVQAAIVIACPDRRVSPIVWESTADRARPALFRSGAALVHERHRLRTSHVALVENARRVATELPCASPTLEGMVSGADRQAGEDES